MNHSKIIFLDFDGVLNTEHHQRQLLYERKAWQDKYGTCFDPEAVKQLQTIVDMTHADIVIESSWKYLGLEAMQDMWKDRQLPGKVIGITPSAISDNILLSTDLDVLDSSMLHCKGAEICIEGLLLLLQGNRQAHARLGSLAYGEWFYHPHPGRLRQLCYHRR